MGITIVAGENSRLELSEDGTTFVKLPYVGNITSAGGEAPETDVVTYEEVGKIVGKRRLPTISIVIPSYVPNLDVWDTIEDAADEKKILSWRMTTQVEEFFVASGAANTVAIATTGVVTFAGDAPDFTGDDFAPGMVVEVGAAKYTIDSITSAGVVTVKPAPAAAVAATMGYKITNPSRRKGPFKAGIRSGDTFELPAEGQLQRTLELTPRARLPKWSLP